MTLRGKIQSINIYLRSVANIFGIESNEYQGLKANIKHYTKGIYKELDSGELKLPQTNKALGDYKIGNIERIMTIKTKKSLVSMANFYGGNVSTNREVREMATYLRQQAYTDYVLKMSSETWYNFTDNQEELEDFYKYLSTEDRNHISVMLSKSSGLGKSEKDRIWEEAREEAFTRIRNKKNGVTNENNRQSEVTPERGFTP